LSVIVSISKNNASLISKKLSKKPRETFVFEPMSTSHSTLLDVECDSPHESTDLIARGKIQETTSMFSTRDEAEKLANKDIRRDLKGSGNF